MCKNDFVAILLSVFLSIFTTTTWAVSFDCQKAVGFIETSICNNTALSISDDRLAEAYQKILQRTADVNAEKQEQRDWLTLRNACTDIDCLSTLTEQRIQVLQEKTTKRIIELHLLEAEKVEKELQLAASKPAIADMPAIESGSPSVSSEPLQEKPQAMPVQPVSDVQQDKEGLSSLQMKMIALFVLINIGFSIYWHHQGRLTIYSDYTDASFTSLTPLLVMVLYAVLAFFEVPTKTASTIAFVFFGVLLLFIAKATYEKNGISIYAAMALLTKLCLVGVYYILMMSLLMGGTPRRDGESLAAYEARRARAQRLNKAIMAALTTFFVGLSAWICRKDEFSPLDKYLALKTTSTP